ncbi:MAG: helix-turn-helix transcriptional regulator [Clostridia bacterium]|nr:helix-turn-helix transcriptional regulator [Clostridia bacterium]
MNNKTYYFGEGTRLGCVLGNEERISFCDSGVQKEITTVAVRFEKISITAGELFFTDACDNSCFLLPAFWEETTQVQEIFGLLNKYIKYSTSNAIYDRAKCISIWFEIIHLIDKQTRAMLSTLQNSSANYYIKKLNFIIETQYNKKISLTQIAKEFNVSLSYLSSIYGSVTGQSFKDAICAVRLKKAKELILTTSLSLADIANAVGICDETYLRKRFKKFFGVSISEFKKINKGLTLYHEKPLRK